MAVVLSKVLPDYDHSAFCYSNIRYGIRIEFNSKRTIISYLRPLHDPPLRRQNDENKKGNVKRFPDYNYSEDCVQEQGTAKNYKERSGLPNAKKHRSVAVAMARPAYAERLWQA